MSPPRSPQPEIISTDGYVYRRPLTEIWWAIATMETFTEAKVGIISALRATAEEPQSRTKVNRAIIKANYAMERAGRDSALAYYWALGIDDGNEFQKKIEKVERRITAQKLKRLDYSQHEFKTPKQLARQ